ncbi:hypothetical protein BR93DRAFT_759997 [Coniochaeta sp. PMI_546]|nr:hypothetical protein BR93DRAFT_759997 [Coniochaeta sp. PMI_546]
MCVQITYLRTFGTAETKYGSLAIYDDYLSTQAQQKMPRSSREKQRRTIGYNEIARGTQHSNDRRLRTRNWIFSSGTKLTDSTAFHITSVEQLELVAFPCISANNKDCFGSTSLHIATYTPIDCKRLPRSAWYYVLKTVLSSQTNEMRVTLPR